MSTDQPILPSPRAALFFIDKKLAEENSAMNDTEAAEKFGSADMMKIADFAVISVGGQWRQLILEPRAGSQEVAGIGDAVPREEVRRWFGECEVFYVGE